MQAFTHVVSTDFHLVCSTVDVTLSHLHISQEVCWAPIQPPIQLNHRAVDKSHDFAHTTLEINLDYDGVRLAMPLY